MYLCQDGAVNLAGENMVGGEKLQSVFTDAVNVIATPSPWAMAGVLLDRLFLVLSPLIVTNKRKPFWLLVPSGRIQNTPTWICQVTAAATTQLLLDFFPIRAAIHFGTAGGADSSLSVGNVVIPMQFSQTGIWDWLKPKVATHPDTDAAELEIASYHIPAGGYNQLGLVAYWSQYFFSETGKPDTPERKC
ncbi:uncharacterized protein [Coffea arabica]|uniref:Nucleoside phosphorylase domain-containing protein n=1 Tax=Coffea arabica TaxID=13443 RepID=A0ABM4WNW0_COFAR